MRRPSPVIILGAGCAGLSLAVHLLEQPGFDNRIVLVEPRRAADYCDDRTWCMFETERHRFSHLATHRWRAWIFASDAGIVERRSRDPSYIRIPAAAFYRECFDRLRDDARVSVELGCVVKHVDDDTIRLWEVDTAAARTLSAAHIFDSRPLPAAAYLGGPSDVCLWQQFVGLEVDVTDGPEFDLGVMTMMDFRTPQRGEIRFAYVLPYSSRSALVELTGFVGSPQDPAVFEADLNDYLVRVLGVKAWHVGRTERGMIPMTTATLPWRATDRVTRIGAAGGMVKPSNGYAFDAIQRQSRQIAESFVGGTVDGRPPVRAISLALDRIFLSYLSKYPERAPELFMRIAAGVGPERFARFMMNRGSYIDDLAVIASMPKWPFICEAVVSRRAWFKSGGGLASRYRVKSMEKGRPAPVSQ